MRLVTELFFFFFQSLSLSSLTWSFPWLLHRNRHFFQSYLQKSFSVYFSTSVLVMLLVPMCLLLSSPLLTSVTDGHWVLKPARVSGTQGDHKEPLTFSRWLGLRLISPCHPRWQNTKAEHYERPPPYPPHPNCDPHQSNPSPYASKL